jgi:hypothetical protein
MKRPELKTFTTQRTIWRNKRIVYKGEQELRRHVISKFGCLNTVT